MQDGLSDLQKVVLNGVQSIIDCLSESETKIPQRSLNKIFIALSYELFMADLEEDGLAVLKKAEIDYFRSGEFQEDMADDADFLFIIETMACKLKEIGYTIEEIDRLYKMKLN